MTLLPASSVAYVLELDRDAEAVVVADDDLNPTWHIEFQREVGGFDEDDYCVVLPSGHTEYGCLESVAITDSDFKLKFLPEMERSVGTEELRITHELGPAGLRLLAELLIAVIGQGTRPPAMHIDPKVYVS